MMCAFMRSLSEISVKKEKSGKWRVLLSGELKELGAGLKAAMVSSSL